MASTLIISCDRCKDEIKSRASWKVTIGRYVYIRDSKRDHVTHEFCEKCYKSFLRAVRDWWHA
jgi:hypothetical protein